MANVVLLMGEIPLLILLGTIIAGAVYFAWNEVGWPLGLLVALFGGSFWGSLVLMLVVTLRDTWHGN